MLMILARLVRSESFWAVVKVRSPHTGPEVSYPRRDRLCTVAKWDASPDFRQHTLAPHPVTDRCRWRPPPVRYWSWCVLSLIHI